MRLPLNDKIIVVTGSSRGIGRAIAEACARAGAGVMVSSRSAENVAACVEELNRQGLKVKGFTTDVSNNEDIQRLFEAAKTEFGKIDVWVNNAGVSGGYRTLPYMTPAEIKEVIDINLMGTFYACRLLVPYFLARGSGIIINMAGRGGRGKPSPYQAPYAASKAAVTSLTRSLAAENRGKPISINCLMPGMVATDLYKDVQACPETESRLRIMPVLLKAFATPMERVQKVAVEMCAVKPGSITGRCYSAERTERYLRALLALPGFMKVMKNSGGSST